MDPQNETETINALLQRVAELEQYAERFRLAAESSRDGMWDWNVVTGEVYYSPRWMEVLGYQPDEIEPNVSTWATLLHPEDAPQVMEALQRHLSDQTTSYEAEFRLKTSSGAWLWALDRGKVVARDTQGQPLRMVGSFTDITERKQAEHLAYQKQAELQQQMSAQSNELLRAHAALNQAADAIYWTDQTGRFVYVNTAACTMLGYTQDELLGMQVTDVDAQISPQEVEAILQSLAQQRTTMFKTVHRRKDGSLFPVEVLVGQVVLDDEMFICSFARDITARMQAEDELRIFQALVENAVDGIAVNTLDGTLTYANPSFYAMHGYNPQTEPMVGTTNFAVLADPTELQAVSQHFDTHSSWQGIIKHRRRDGSTFPVQASVFLVCDTAGHPYALAIIDRDVTEQKRKEDELRLFKSIVERANDGISFTDAQSRISYANPAYRELFGYGDEIIGMAVSEIVAHEGISLLEAGMQEVLARGSWRGESINRRKDGSTFPVEVSVFTVQDDTGAIQTTVGMVRDITERKRAEAELRLAKFSLDRSVDMIHWLSPDAEILYANDAACAALGYTREEMLRKRIFDIDPVFPEEEWASMWSGLKQRGFVNIETIHRHRDGHTIPIEVRGNYLEFEGREYSCVFGRDISERKQAEDERQQLQQQIILAQQSAIRELSSPLLPIADHILALPLIGTIDSTRAQQVMETLLQGIATHQASVVIIDITGVQLVDTQVAQALIQTAQAVKLLGAQVILTGIQPPMAQTLVQLGADMRGMLTRSTLQAGIAEVLHTAYTNHQRGGIARL